MNRYNVFCVVNCIPSDEEYKEIEDKLVKNTYVKFITRAKGSNKVLIGVNRKKSFYINDSKYVCKQRKYYKCYIENTFNTEEINKIKEYIDSEYDASYIAVTDGFIYFSIRDQKKFREIADKIFEVEYQNIKFKIHSIYNKNTKIMYTIQINTGNDENITIEDVKKSLSSFCNVRYRYTIKRLREGEMEKVFVFTSIDENVRDKLKDYKDFSICKIFSVKISKKPKIYKPNQRKIRY